ncbi:helix-turn-helix transcriptional regulator [Adlercreutzia faecimuris]|uniref:Helix-turn-helix transcriptional regulator n=1 Tax=Adlercreutzia faecimuris TaxID=2897341 RepID=A0ABS9WDY2_9ACTN|nr:helix-turn-helix transcriptional regulator [Adlercreutzia sp. JBNU-10]MCI2241079.1 helix-turn-helix transcriptional regulator [Adlercreutzia sp. JBNU-10]
MTTQAPARGTGRHLDFANAQGQRFRLQVEDDPVDACAFTVRVIPLPEPLEAAAGASDHRRAAAPTASTTPVAAAALAALTAREREVAALIAEGLTNDQVAGRLYICRSTVKTHLQSIYAKAGVPNRTALVALLHAVA